MVETKKNEQISEYTAYCGQRLEISANVSLNAAKKLALVRLTDASLFPEFRAAKNELLQLKSILQDSSEYTVWAVLIFIQILFELIIQIRFFFKNVTAQLFLSTNLNLIRCRLDSEN